jgi:hypothetical protein
MLAELIHFLYILQASPNAPSQQLDFWRDPAWQSAGVIVALISVVIALKQFKRKALSYEIILEENIVQIADDSIEGELQIFYQGREIKDLYLVTVKFTNSGDVEIKSEDYARPISLNFGDDAKILGSKVLKQFPDNLGIIISHDIDREIIITEPTLLNGKDSFTIQTLVTGFQTINIDDRIAGIKKN